ncbi:hypothetical protein CGRA01v4_11933 [Colletotrichum graminicola]|nr:hypothetical protein CGRA01v4_11933 [Colletotrichum graminicola]
MAAIPSCFLARWRWQGNGSTGGVFRVRCMRTLVLDGKQD